MTHIRIETRKRPFFDFSSASKTPENTLLLAPQNTYKQSAFVNI
jgi:hypothetical protein